MKLDRLYKSTKTGAIQICDIEIIDDKFIVTFGQLDGKLQIKETICLPKNIGKANETTGAQQAESEALAKHAKKIKSGYSLDKEAPTTVMLPMKVKVIQDQWKNVKYPCVSTPKLNGVNGTYRLEDNKLNLYKRGGDLFPEIPHLKDQILEAMNFMGCKELNVELYIQNTHLQDITSAVTKTKELSKELEAAIFDISDNTVLTYSSRRLEMIRAEDILTYTDISFITGIQCNNRQDIENHYNECMALGLEGTVVKNLDGLYQHNIRSSDQFKYKKTLDAEFKTVNYNIDKNGHPVFICQSNKVNSDGTRNTFKVKPKGTNTERLAIAKQAFKLEGQWLKIEFETYSKDGIPLKPVGLLFRDCDASGNPIE